jgi:hypothetical protein
MLNMTYVLYIKEVQSFSACHTPAKGEELWNKKGSQQAEVPGPACLVCHVLRPELTTQGLSSRD